MAAKLQVTFKSGAQIEADVTSFTRQSNAFNSFVGAKWETPADAVRALMYLDVEEVAAVVFIEEPQETTENG